MKPILVVEGIAEESLEDSGQALILDVADDSHSEWVRLHSWCEDCTHHPLLAPLVGKRLRITVELVDDTPPGHVQ